VVKIEALLVTGSNGFVGRSFINFLDTLPVDALPNRLCLVSRDGKYPSTGTLNHKTNLTFLVADLLDPWLFTFPATHIAHFAADGSANAYSPEAAMKFLKITANLNKWVLGLDSPMLFFASSGACFGHFSLDGEFYSPETITRKENDSDLIHFRKKELISSRLQAEESLLELEAFGKLDLRIGRLFSFIGNSLYNKSQYAVNDFISMALSKGVIAIKGNPNTVRSYLSESEMADWIYRSFSTDLDAKILTIGSATPVSIYDLANHVKSITGAEIQIKEVNELGDTYVADNRKTLAALGVSEVISWQNALQTYVTFFREMRENEK
jgi:nucleoside-diphosphate-sugar epimerase